MPIDLKPESATELFDQIKRSRELWRKDFAPRAEKDRALYSGDHYAQCLYPNGSPGDEGFKEVTVNPLGANIRIKVATLAFERPTFEVEPLDEDDVERELDEMVGQLEPSQPGFAEAQDELRAEIERQMQIRPLVQSELLTTYYEAGGGPKAAKAALLDKFANGSLGVVMTLWDNGQVDPFAPETVQKAAAGTVQGFNADMAQEPGVKADDLEPPGIPVVGEGPRAVRIDPNDFSIDPDVTWDNWGEAAFMARDFTMPLADLKNQKVPGAEKLHGSATPKEAGSESDLNPHRTSLPPEDPDCPNVMLREGWFRSVWFPNAFTYEVTDPATGEATSKKRLEKGYYPLRVVWALELGPEAPLRVEIWKYDLRDELGRRIYPFDLMINCPKPSEFFGQSDAEIMEDQQRELNASRSVEATQADISSRIKVVMSEAAFPPDPNQEEALDCEQPGVVLKMRGNGSAQDAIAFIAPPAVNSGAEAQGEHAIRDMNVNSGVDEMAQGVHVNGAETLGENELIAQRSGSRAAQETREWEDFNASIARKFYQLLVQYQLIGSQVRIQLPESLGGDGGQVTVTVQPTHLIPSRVRIVTGSTQQQNKQQKIQNLVQFVTLCGQMGVLATPMNPIGFVSSRYVVKLMAELLDLDRGGRGLWDVTEFKEMMAGGPGGAPGMPGAPGGAPPPPPPPKQPFESIQYKDVPEDIKRQMEAQAGLQPSTMPPPLPLPPGQAGSAKNGGSKGGPGGGNAQAAPQGPAQGQQGAPQFDPAELAQMIHEHPELVQALHSAITGGH